METDASALREEGASFLHTISPTNRRYIKNNPQKLKQLNEQLVLPQQVHRGKSKDKDKGREKGKQKPEGDSGSVKELSFRYYY